ncbi:MAG TPA: NAD-dependent deacylase [Gemmatimonadaceae bacterium]|nr:NAD-dependent deacylase [Gemmatimonadaceae bacterium]
MDARHARDVRRRLQAGSRGHRPEEASGERDARVQDPRQVGATIAAENLAAAAGRLRAASSIVVFTGAGVSAESGIPTYRSGSDGLWSRQNLERFANPAGYAAHLPESYDWYRARARGVAGCHPNPAHLAIAELADIVPDFVLVTQNIDSLHQRAGSRDVIELHGNLREFRCAACGRRVTWDEAPEAPTCASCGGMLRPGVVMFNENLPEAALARARAAAERCDVLLSVGTSNQVYPAAELPMIALSSGRTVIIVNPDLTDQPFHRNVIGIHGRAGDTLPMLLDLLR